jgi:hypothetical protein
VKTGFLCGKWVLAKGGGQRALLGTYEGECFWNVTIFPEYFTLLERVETALAGDFSAKQLICHEDDLELDPVQDSTRFMMGITD